MTKEEEDKVICKLKKILDNEIEKQEVNATSCWEEIKDLVGGRGLAELLVNGLEDIFKRDSYLKRLQWLRGFINSWQGDPMEGLACARRRLIGEITRKDMMLFSTNLVSNYYSSCDSDAVQRTIKLIENIQDLFEINVL